MMALSNRGRIGDRIVQPGRLDNSPQCATRNADTIASLSQFRPIDFSGRCVNTIDAAIARTSTKYARPEIARIGRPNSAILTPMLRMRVKKSGRTTQLTNGYISAINATVRVNYGSAGVACFRGQTIIRPIGRGPFSAPGDSGSLIVESGVCRRPVGLLFAGSNVVTIANPIADVLRYFRARIWGW